MDDEPHDEFVRHDDLGVLVHTKTHGRLAELIYRALPPDAQAFVRFSDVELHWHARSPDEIEGDNLLTSGGDTEHEQYAHTYKLHLEPDGSLHHLVGSAPTVIAQTPRLCRDAIREGKFDEARERFVQTFCHYAVDLSTPWHVTRSLTSAQHKGGELDIAKHNGAWLPKDLAPLALSDPKSLYRSAVGQAERTYRMHVVALEQVQAPDGNIPDNDVAKAIVADAAGFGLAVALYTWRWMASA